MRIYINDANLLSNTASFHSATEDDYPPNGYIAEYKTWTNIEKNSLLTHNFSDNTTGVGNHAFAPYTQLWVTIQGASVPDNIGSIRYTGTITIEYELNE